MTCLPPWDPSKARPGCHWVSPPRMAGARAYPREGWATGEWPAGETAPHGVHCHHSPGRLRPGVPRAEIEGGPPWRDAGICEPGDQATEDGHTRSPPAPCSRPGWRGAAGPETALATGRGQLCCAGWTPPVSTARTGTRGTLPPSCPPLPPTLAPCGIRERGSASSCGWTGRGNGRPSLRSQLGLVGAPEAPSRPSGWPPCRPPSVHSPHPWPPVPAAGCPLSARPARPRLPVSERPRPAAPTPTCPWPTAALSSGQRWAPGPALSRTLVNVWAEGRQPRPRDPLGTTRVCR